MYGARRCTPEMAQLLILHGADPLGTNYNVEDKENQIKCGLNAIHVCCQETKTTNHNSNPFNQQQPGKLPAIGLEFLSKLVRAFDYSNLAQMKVPMKNISNSISLFRPMLYLLFQSIHEA